MTGISLEDRAAAEKARRWACAEHAVILNIQSMRRQSGHHIPTLDMMEREARRKRMYALLRLSLNLKDNTVPEGGTDEEIGAYLGFDAPAEGVANV